MSQTTTVIGDGGWGTALAIVLQQNGHAVTVWGPFAENIEAANRTHRNETFLPGIDLPPEIRWTTDPEEAVRGANAVVMATPTQYYRDVAKKFRGLITPEMDVVSVAKGLDRETHKTMTGVAEEILEVSPVAVLSGPSHAEEVARGIPTAVVIASHDESQATVLQNLFSNGHFRAYTTTDALGVQLGGALKNVIAIAVGISDGLGFGDNTRAALITRGLAEMTRLGTQMGCHPATFAGLSGMGDLIVTCTSGHSRNRAVGERLGRGESIDDILTSMKQVAEGVWNCSNARALGHSQGVELPITEEVYGILHGNKSPIDAVQDLMGRDVKPE
jgi:glycerol-3-phosphate dehydrogenase (NAD(P)+)